LRPPFNHIFRKPYVLLLPAVFLYLLSFFFTTDYSQRTSVDRELAKLENYLHTRQIDFLNLLRDTSLIQKLVSKTETLKEFEGVIKKPYGIFLYSSSSFDENNLIFWSDQMLIPPAESHYLPDGEYFQHLPNGYYLCFKINISHANRQDKLTAIAMIPVQYNYFLETDYLPNQFIYSSSADEKIMISTGNTEYPVKSLNGKTLFYLSSKAHTELPRTPMVMVWLRLVAILFLLVFIHFFAGMVSRYKGAWAGIGVLMLILAALRILSYFFPFPFNLRQFGLFDPSVYGSNAIQKSLGDLLINAVLFCWIAIFAWSRLSAGENNLFEKKSRSRWPGILAAVLFVFFTFITANLVRSLTADSDISFDVTDFYSLDKYSVFGFVALAFIAIGYYYFTKILARFIANSFHTKSFLVYFVMAVTGLTYLSFIIDSPLVQFFIFVLGWLLAYSWVLLHPGFFINRFRFNVATTLFWIFIFSISISVVIIEANRGKEWEIRKKLAEKLDVQSDPYNESQLSISFAYLDNNFLVNNLYRFRDTETNRLLRDSILRQSLYLKNFDTRIFVFEAGGTGLYNEEAESLNALNTLLRVQAKPTSLPDLYYYETSFDRFTFILRRQAIDSSGNNMGSLFIISKPKNYSSIALYPELFRQDNQNDPSESPVYAYAVYKKNALISPFNKYPFATSLTPDQSPSSEYEKRINGDYVEMWYRASVEKVVVVAKKRGSLIEVITLFSYVFCSFLFIVALLGLAAFLLRAINNVNELKKLWQLNIRVQVHSTIILISLLSFVIIGISTISFFKSRYRSNNVDKLSRTMSIMVNEMQKKLDRLSAFDDIIPIYDSVANQEVQFLLNEVAEIHNVDVNVYDTTGHLHVSSQPLIYHEGYLGPKMHPLAFFHLNRLRQIQYEQQEKLATFSYQSIYAPARDRDGNVKVYLNIPYFLSQRELNQEISNFLVTIINLNAFIFLIAGVIALFITNRITRSFSVISEKMKQVNLDKTNEEIEWNRNDEIGELVKGYNKMVNKLEESAAALARSEREGAWREMARQVAHEIKNPLTPMKLSIQYLQRSIDNNSGNVKELTANVARTLIEQIDHLSKIAADFSQFANIGNTNIETFDINEVIRSLGDLYRANHEVELVLNIVNKKVILKADKTQMNRLFTNLFQNAIEACTGKDKSRVIVHEIKMNGVVRISIKDNGEGIPDEMHAKIFVPNFTTKSSGTGLGLAMCKSIVEQAGGRIWFETSDGEGSTFHVELPTVN